MLVPCYSHAFWLHQNFEQNFRYISCAGSQDLGFGNPKMPDPWWAKNSHGFPLNHALIERLGTIFKKISSLKSPNLILKNIQIAISIRK